MDRYLRLAAFWITVSSAAVIVFFALQGGRLPATPVFKNPILQAIASALAALVFLHALLRKFRRLDMLLLVLNAAAVIISASKAAFLGLALFAAAMILARKRKWLPYLIAVLALLVLLPNPMRRMAEHSLRHDPYVLNRLDIWSMSARMFRGHFWTGVGPDLFAAAAKQYNFPQENGPARYFKLPESAHSDYWKVIAENGLPGLILVVVGAVFRHPPPAVPALVPAAEIAAGFSAGPDAPDQFGIQFLFSPALPFAGAGFSVRAAELRFAAARFPGLRSPACSFSRL